MTTEENPRLPVGSIVTIDDPRCPGLYRIMSHNPKNEVLTPVKPDGNIRPGRQARMPPYLLHLYDPAADPVPPVPPSIFIIGEVVTVRAQIGLWVVIADKMDKVNVTRLGGDHNRYLRVPPAMLTRIPLSEIPTRFAAVFQ
jgi:hypothetical protein